MCKSQAEGGQRCAGHAKTRMDELITKGEEALDRLQHGEITMTQAQAVHAQVADAMIDYASTLDGAKAFRQDLSDSEPYYVATGEPFDEDADANDDIRRLIDDGATRAQVNREVENAYRVTQGMGPLTTALPQTFAQEQEAAAAAAAAAESKAAWGADPLGLRAAEDSRPSLAHDEWTFEVNDVAPQVIAPNSPTSRDAHIQEATDSWLSHLGGRVSPTASIMIAEQVDGSIAGDLAYQRRAEILAQTALGQPSNLSIDTPFDNRPAFKANHTRSENRQQVKECEEVLRTRLGAQYDALAARYKGRLDARDLTAVFVATHKAAHDAYAGTGNARMVGQHDNPNVQTSARGRFEARVHGERARNGRTTEQEDAAYAEFADAFTAANLDRACQQTLDAWDQNPAPRKSNRIWGRA